MNTFDETLAFFLTWSTYGTWLPGDSRGWTEYHHGWKFPDPQRLLEASARMTEEACILSKQQRIAVESQIKETCDARGWQLHAVNCRTNHVHSVVTATETSPKKVRRDLKSWTTRRLRREFDRARENWWGERGSVRHIFDETGLEAAIIYVTEGQDRARG